MNDKFDAKEDSKHVFELGNIVHGIRWIGSGSGSRGRSTGRVLSVGLASIVSSDYILHYSS